MFIINIAFHSEVLVSTTHKFCHKWRFCWQWLFWWGNGDNEVCLTLCSLNMMITLNFPHPSVNYLQFRNQQRSLPAVLRFRNHKRCPPIPKPRTVSTCCPLIPKPRTVSTCCPPIPKPRKVCSLPAVLWFRNQEQSLPAWCPPIPKP